MYVFKLYVILYASFATCFFQPCVFEMYICWYLFEFMCFYISLLPYWWTFSVCYFLFCYQMNDTTYLLLGSLWGYDVYSWIVGCLHFIFIGCCFTIFISTAGYGDSHFSAFLSILGMVRLKILYLMFSILLMLYFEPLPLSFRILWEGLSIAAE